MSLWGPAVEAEIEYRQAEARKAWGGRGTSGADRAGRAERRAARRAERTVERRSERQVRADRAEQIREGIAGMRPASTGRRGLFA
ncbi:hypothetical protein [Promicromonospora iranensis]|uniref:Uncharacterized protein n=1 Tax=Promicromonospora iranensis TaxID=1105144 RepID=A0ABU2CP80_9MICO|nr:hypothetical protein [Promicromonospora iranensis]MDR7383130.1 hypothetical protein [Promicromonospora iranensis]